MCTRNWRDLSVGDYYVVYFGFPLRNNGLVSNACTYPGSTIYGDAYYHLNNWVIVCYLNQNGIGVPAYPNYYTQNLRISGFFTPYYYLSSTEKTIYAYGYNFGSRYTSYAAITDGYPNEGPKIATTPSITVTPVH
jgi:hypothetical protein